MKRIICLILIVTFTSTFIGSSFAADAPKETPPASEAPPKATIMEAPGSPQSPDSPPATQMNSVGLSQMQSYSNSVIDDHVDPVSGALVIKQTDLVIPGRGGLDLVISRSYNSRRFSTPPGLLSAAQQYFVGLFGINKTSRWERLITEEGKVTFEVTKERLTPDEILKREQDNPKSDAFSGFIGHGWTFDFAGSLMALTYSGDKRIDKFQFPYNQLIVQYSGGSARFRENFERTGIYYSQEKGNDDIVKAEGSGYVLLKKNGQKYYFNLCFFDRYHCFVGDDIAERWGWQKYFLLSRIEDVRGSKINFAYDKYMNDEQDEIVKHYREKTPPSGSVGAAIGASFGSVVDTLSYISIGYYETMASGGIHWVAVARLLDIPTLSIPSAIGNVILPVWGVIFLVAAFLYDYFTNEHYYVYYEKIGYHSTHYKLKSIEDSCNREISVHSTFDPSLECCVIDQISRADAGFNIAYKYKYSPDGNLLSFSPPIGNSTNYYYRYLSKSLSAEFDDKGFVLSRINSPTGVNVDFSFSWYNPRNDPDANISLINDKNESKYSFYAVSERSISAMGRSTFIYNGGAPYNSTRDNAAAGIAWAFLMFSHTDMLGRLYKQGIIAGVPVQNIDPNGFFTTFGWDLKNYNLRDVVVERGSNTITTQYRQFDDFGNFHTQTEGGDPNTLADDRTTHIEYVYEKNPAYKDNGMTSLVARQWIDKNGTFKEVVNEYDSAGKGNLLKKIEKVNGKDFVTQYEYDSFGNVIKQTDPNDTVTLFEYSPEYKSAYLTKMTKTVGGKTLIATKTYYFNTGRLKSETDFNGNVTSYEYDLIGRMLKKTNPDGTYTSYTYNDANNEIEMRDERGEITTYKYDTLGRLSSVVFPDGKTLSYQYNAVSKVVASIDRAGRKTNYSYDDLDRITKVTYPDGSYAEYSYDDSHNMTAVEDALGNTSKYKYDNFGNLVDVTQADGERALYDYDAIGDMTSITDPRLLATKHFYDSGGRLLRTEYPDGSNYEFEYDELGNPVKKVDAKGEAINYTYDEMGRITGSGYRDAGSDVVRSYDASLNGKGLLSAMKDPSGITTFNYDKMGRIVEKVKTAGSVTFTTAFEYDEAGNMLSIKDPVGQGKTGYKYDEMNRVEEVVRGQVPVVSYKYNPSNTIKSIVFANGNTVKYTYDLRDRIHTLTILDKKGNEILKYNYDYDAVGNLVRHDISPSESFAYGYDKVYRLTNVSFPSEGDHTYKYDPAGNRTAFKYAYGDVSYAYEPRSNALDYYDINGNGKVDLSYDKNGNLTRQEKFQGDNVVEAVNYTFDPEDRMTEIDSPAVKMTYDGNGMRASKTANGETILYHYDLANNVICETDDNGKVKETYVYANGMRVCRIDPDGRMFYFHNDPLGSPIMITDEDGNAVQRYVYDPFGTMILSKGPDNNHYTYTGKEYDNESGLMYYGARFYDPKIGRFISRDIAAPDWGEPQSLNRYVYCFNNPLILVDLNGKDAIAYVDRDAFFGNGHMGLIYQNEKGEWFKADLYPEAQNWHAITGIHGVYEVIKQGNFDVKDFFAKKGSDAMYLKTTPYQDKLIEEHVLNMQEAFESNDISYKLFKLNCVVVTVGALKYGLVPLPAPSEISDIPDTSFDQMRNYFLQNNVSGYMLSSYNFENWSNLNLYLYEPSYSW